jgi:hypothetical protein
MKNITIQIFNIPILATDLVTNDFELTKIYFPIIGEKVASISQDLLVQTKFLFSF